MTKGTILKRTSSKSSTASYYKNWKGTCKSF